MRSPNQAVEATGYRRLTADVSQEKMKPKIITGDLLDQKVDVIVNAWNRNLIPWWLLLPQGVSGAIKKKSGVAPFCELRKYRTLALGQAVLTGAGRLPLKGIIHVAGIGHLWMPSEESVRLATRNALIVAKNAGYHSIAFPLIGAGTGGMKREKVLDLMTQEIETAPYDGEVTIVVYDRQRGYRDRDAPCGAPLPHH